MSTMRLAVAAILMACLPAAALAWGEDGHRVVCQIAYDELTEAARAEVDRLLALDADFDSFAESCLFADEPERIRWMDHFINLPRSTAAITTRDCPLADSCVLSAIDGDVAILRNPLAGDADRLRAMKLLGHWVGDAHQPLHVSFQDDRGANSIAIAGDDPDANLHGIWDYEILAASFGNDYRRIAAEFRNGISDAMRAQWRHDSAIEWVNESLQITIAAATRYCVMQQGACWYTKDNMLLDRDETWRRMTISDAYLRKHGPTVRLRLQQAGVRLAEILNGSFVQQTEPARK